MCIRDRYTTEHEVNEVLRRSRENLRTEAHGALYHPSCYNHPFVHPADGLGPGSAPMQEHLTLDSNSDPRYKAWQRITQAPALKVEAYNPTVGRVHERRRGAPLQYSMGAPIRMSDPIGAEHLAYRRDQIETVAPTDEGSAWAPNRVFFKQSHMGRFTNSDQPGGPVGGPSSSERADQMIVEEFERMERRFAERKHRGAGLGCGAPARVYPDAWSRDTPNWETQHEERAHGVPGDTSFWYAKESQLAQSSTRLSPPRQRKKIVISDPVIPLTCVQTGLPIVDESKAVIKCGVVPYIDQAAAKADWQRHQREALYLNAFMDRFGRAVSYPAYVSAQQKQFSGTLSWNAHAQPASHNPFLSVVPPQPMAWTTASKCGQLRCNSSLLAANGAGQLVEYSLEGGRSLGGLPQQTGEDVTALCLCDDLVIVGTVSGSVTMASFGGGDISLTAHTGAVTDIHCTGDIVASAGADGLVHVSAVSNAALVVSLEGHMEAVNCVRGFASGVFCQTDTVVSGSSDGNLRMWDVATGQCVDIMRNHAEAIFCLELVGDRLFSGAADGVRVWSVSQHKCLLELPQCGDVRALGVVGSALSVASLRVDHMDLMLYDWETSTCIARLETMPAGPEVLFWIDMSFDRLGLTVHDPKKKSQDAVLVWDFSPPAVLLPSAARNQFLYRN
eukprot:TRINITY_DN15413_c0_g1_i1.p1 TRINITY_DN15413_c0_g1~~TRINITY_DN15413_c0_g1_i1.p1  ORF type:complete len:672 (+),score=134.86 TRINITY_DN15413_c0_g1_i1:152-2167(+)